MLLLADCNYAAATLVEMLAATKADLLIRCKTGRRLPEITRYHDGSWLSTIGTLRVRVIDARIAVKTNDGTRTSGYRLITTLLDPHRHPAGELIRLYHQRGEIETAYLELKSSILGGRVLRARTPDGIDQEIHALLIIYQTLRTAMVDATDSQPGTDPDRASFTTALNTARNQITLAAGVTGNVFPSTFAKIVYVTTFWSLRDAVQVSVTVWNVGGFAGTTPAAEQHRAARLALPPPDRCWAAIG
ncbi:transposase [Actinoplanes sp. NPDC051513]|uniref:transposase n=1 Tax=Actinoplanes sp. NPDC051513 TaxID=3363908 RepID=UPI0037A6A33F